MTDISLIKLLVLHPNAIINFLQAKLSYVEVVCEASFSSGNYSGVIILGENCPEGICPGVNFLGAIVRGRLSKGNCYVTLDISFARK